MELWPILNQKWRCTNRTKKKIRQKCCYKKKPTPEFQYLPRTTLIICKYTTFITSVLNIIRLHIMAYKNYIVQKNFIKVFSFLLCGDVLIFVQDRPAREYVIRRNRSAVV
jgi:hypothetical protein